MRHGVENKAPSTYTVQFFDVPDSLRIYDGNGQVYYYRDLPPNTRNVKVNIPDKGIYYFDAEANIQRGPISICREVYNIKLPPPERNREKDYTIKHDPNLTSSPAIIYTERGLIITGRKFESLPAPMKVFILLHELGHFRYETEKYCDLYAIREFILMGYNPSTGVYCLTDQLRSTPMNDERIRYIYDKLLQSEIIK